MIFTKFHKNRLIFDGEINEKHTLLASCGLIGTVEITASKAYLLNNMILYRPKSI